MTKEILLVVPGQDGERIGRPALIEPETTAADLLRAAELDPDTCHLQVKQGVEFVSLQGKDRLFEHVGPGEKVFVYSTQMVVGLAT